MLGVVGASGKCIVGASQQLGGQLGLVRPWAEALGEGRSALLEARSWCNGQASVVNQRRTVDRQQIHSHSWQQIQSHGARHDVSHGVSVPFKPVAQLESIRHEKHQARQASSIRRAKHPSQAHPARVGSGEAGVASSGGVAASEATAAHGLCAPDAGWPLVDVNRSDGISAFHDIARSLRMYLLVPGLHLLANQRLPR